MISGHALQKEGQTKNHRDRNAPNQAFLQGGAKLVHDFNLSGQMTFIVKDYQCTRQSFSCPRRSS